MGAHENPSRSRGVGVWSFAIKEEVKVKVLALFPKHDSYKDAVHTEEEDIVSY